MANFIVRVGRDQFYNWASWFHGEKGPGEWPQVSRADLRLDNLAGWSDGLIFFGTYLCALTRWL